MNRRIISTLLSLLFVLSLNAQDGKLDPGFATGGKFKFAHNSASLFSSGAVYPNGSIIAAGQTVNQGLKGLVIRVDSFGKMDKTFGTNGIVENNLGRVLDVEIAGSEIIVLTGTMIYKLDNSGNVTKTASFSSGTLMEKMALSGSAAYTIGHESSKQTVVHKYNLSTLALDATFANGGVYKNTFSSNANWEKGQAIVHAGGNTYGLVAYAADSATRFDDIGYLFKLDGSGKLVSGFGTNGSALISDTTDDNWQPKYLVWDASSNKLLIGGNLYVIRVLSGNGNLDASFGTNGIYKTGETGTFASLTVQPDGKPIIFTWKRDPTDLRLIRVTSSGSIDNTFGTNGEVLTHVAPNDFSDDVICDPVNNKIIAIGHGDDNAVIGTITRHISSKSASIKRVETREIQTYPNPSAGTVHLSNQISGVQSVDLVTLNGKVINLSVEQINGSTFTIDRSMVPAGVYFLRIQTNEAAYNLKLILSDN